MQISSNDIVRVGDWVEMPALNADGDVIDIALHTVKVQKLGQNHHDNPDPAVYYRLV